MRPLSGREQLEITGFRHFKTEEEDPSVDVHAVEYVEQPDPLFIEQAPDDLPERNLPDDRGPEQLTDLDLRRLSGHRCHFFQNYLFLGVHRLFKYQNLLRKVF